MFLKLTRMFGKPICVLLYGVFGLLAGRRKPLPLLILFGLHAGEYLLKGRRLAAEKGLHPLEGLAQCLAFGFTWWLPLEKS